MKHKFFLIILLLLFVGCSRTVGSLDNVELYQQLALEKSDLTAEYAKYLLDARANSDKLSDLDRKLFDINKKLIELSKKPDVISYLEQMDRENYLSESNRSDRMSGYALEEATKDISESDIDLDEDNAFVYESQDSDFTVEDQGESDDNVYDADDFESVSNEFSDDEVLEEDSDDSGDDMEMDNDITNDF